MKQRGGSQSDDKFDRHNSGLDRKQDTSEAVVTSMTKSDLESNGAVFDNYDGRNAVVKQLSEDNDFDDFRSTDDSSNDLETDYAAETYAVGADDGSNNFASENGISDNDEDNNDSQKRNHLSKHQ
uniref:Bravo_FIGEY domain-containing protein n=1 Tax=Syphacia muris TaxID=451379 RepID=A0A0N5AMU0_9BILA